VHHVQERFQAVGTVNYPNDYGYTRISEFKHITGQQHAGTSVVYEYPCAEGDPYYPVPQPQNARLYEKYVEQAEATPGVTFVGRLASYRYYNMDQVVAQALATFKRLQQAQETRDTSAGRAPQAEPVAA
jgi:UDP-galactopyranose mutase